MQGSGKNAVDPPDDPCYDEEDVEAQQDFDDFKSWLDKQDAQKDDSPAPVPAAIVDKPSRDPVHSAVCKRCKKAPQQCHLYQLD